MNTKINEIAISTNKDVFLEQARILNKEFLKKPKKTVQRMLEYISDKYGLEMVIVFTSQNKFNNNVTMPIGCIDWEVYKIQTVEMEIVTLNEAVKICRQVRNEKRERQFNGYMPRYQ